MPKTNDPLITPARNNPPAASSVVDGAQLDMRGALAGWWRSVMENNARLITESTDCLLVQLSQNQQLVSEQLHRISATTERVASLMSHAAIRAVAIATKARNKESDRRVFTLPLPTERRLNAMMDRRKADLANNTLQ
jgi:hypothetical protein